MKLQTQSDVKMILVGNKCDLKDKVLDVSKGQVSKQNA